MTRIRLLKASPVYPASLEGVYAGYPDLEGASYDDQYRAIMGMRFGWSDFWKMHLEATGGFEVVEVVTNARSLQRAWAREHGVDADGPGWITDVVRAQVLHYQPDIVFAHDYVHLDPGFILRLKRERPRLRLVAYDGIAICDPERFRSFDLVLGCLESICETYRAAGIESHLYRLGFEASIRRGIPERERTCPVSFVGSLSLGSRGHRSRCEALDLLARQLPLSLYLKLPPPIARWGAIPWDLLHGRVRQAFVETPRQLGHIGRLLPRSLGPRFGLDMYEVMARSAITLNFHIDAAGNEAGNMRLFEATGMGACLVTDLKGNLGSLFQIGEEVVAFESPEDCLEKVRGLLDDPARRERIARAGQARTLRDHTFEAQVRLAGDRLRALCGA